jgi:hypothetical protein
MDILSSAPQPSLSLGLLLKIRLNFLEASQQFFYRVGLLAPRQTPIPEDQASVFISPRGRVTTHFSHLLRHAWVTVGLFLFPGHHTGSIMDITPRYCRGRSVMHLSSGEWGYTLFGVKVARHTVWPVIN